MTVPYKPVCRWHWAEVLSWTCATIAHWLHDVHVQRVTREMNKEIVNTHKEPLTTLWRHTVTQVWNNVQYIDAWTFCEGIELVSNESRLTGVNWRTQSRRDIEIHGKLVHWKVIKIMLKQCLSFLCSRWIIDYL